MFKRKQHSDASIEPINFTCYYLVLKPLAVFQRMVGNLYKSTSYVKIYNEDVVVRSKSMREHFGHLIEVCGRVSAIGLTVRISKCEFAKDGIEFIELLLAHVG